jgi:hypothetical protein
MLYLLSDSFRVQLLFAGVGVVKRKSALTSTYYNQTEKLHPRTHTLHNILLALWSSHNVLFSLKNSIFKLYHEGLFFDERVSYLLMTPFVSSNGNNLTIK